MKAPTPSAKRISYSTGKLAESSSKQTSIFDKLVSTRPFTQQLDVVFPLVTGSDLDKQLEKVELTYYRKRWTLSQFIQFVTDHRFEIVAAKDGEGSDRTLAAVGLSGPSDDDSWCFDGEMLTISVGEDTWQRFNLGEGTSLPWREHRNIKYYRYSLAKLAELSTKLKNAFKSWDEERGPWDVLYYRGSSITLPNDSQEGEARQVRSTIRRVQNVYIPPARLPQSPPLAKEDWEDEVSGLFEWAGLASLGSQRLQMADNPDPYIAVYEPPDGSKPGELVHIRWKGFIPRPFLHTVLKIIADDHSIPLVSVTGHGLLQSPVTYVGPNAKQQRISSGESEDTWSLILSREEKSGQLTETRWLLGECIGKWDSRLG